MILRSEHIAKSFGKKKVLIDVSFELDKGTITGIVGENGSGKSVLMEIIVGLRKAGKGAIHIDGRVGYCPQKALLFPQLTVSENFNYFSVAYGLESKWSERRSTELMDVFNFEEYRHERVGNLSGGTQQKLNLSIALLTDPDLLILDEPYNGFDWDTYVRFWEYSMKLREKGSAILIVTHLLGEKERLDHMYNLKKGVLM